MLLLFKRIILGCVGTLQHSHSSIWIYEMNNPLQIKHFEVSEHPAAYRQAEELFKSGGHAPFMEVGYYSDMENEPLHLYLDDKLVGVATLLSMGDGAELHKLYVHPDFRGQDVGRNAARASIDYLFKKYDVEDVSVSILGDSAKFWWNIVQSYGERAVYTDSNCYVVKDGVTAKDIYPYLFDN